MDLFKPRAERVGAHTMEVGEVIKVSLSDVTENERKNSYYLIQSAIHGHGSYYGKSFQCKTVEGVLYVKRKS